MRSADNARVISCVFYYNVYNATQTKHSTSLHQYESGWVWLTLFAYVIPKILYGHQRETI